MPLARLLPVAQVRIDSPLPHLDRVFDYAVPERMDPQVRPGVRVRVRFAGRLVNGYVVGRQATSGITTTLKPLERVLSPEVVLTEEVRALVEAVAARYAGTFSDVVRAAVPPRHARAESIEVPPATASATAPSAAWSDYSHGPALIARLSDGSPTGLRGVWSAAPAHAWIDDVADAARAVLTRPRGGVLVVVPDAWDVRRLREAMGDCEAAVLTADLGPERRYREFLRILRGGVRLVIGTRAAVFAPLADLELVVVWDDGDETLWEPHAPYWNARDVAAVRSHLTGCALLIGSPTRTPEAQQLCESGWAQSLVPTRDRVRATAPVIRAIEPGDDAADAAAATARIPRSAWLVAKEGLRSGPVLIQVGRRGYLPVLACVRCREPATCACGGPLSMISGSSIAQCRWCGTPANDWACRSCGAARFRAAAVGVERTAEEFGRAFPGERIVWSSGEQVIRTVAAEPAIVVATPGAEPVADGGYAAIVILDARAQLHRPHLRAQEEAAHRWFSACLLARPKAHVVVTAENATAPVQALARWDAVWLAERELSDRASAGLPPARRAAVLRGAGGDIDEVAAALSVEHRVLGPVDGRAIVLSPRDRGADLARELRAITATRAAKASAGQVSVMLDPRSFDA